MMKQINKKIPFFKMNVSGNDFIFIDKKYAFDIRFVSTLMCNRKLGIGCDQLITYHEEKENLVLQVDIMNNDGSFAEVCGNSFLCAGNYFANKNSWTNFTILSKKKSYNVDYHNDITHVNMGSFLAKEINLSNLNMPDDKYINMFYVNVGNPHVVVFMQNHLTKQDALDYGPLIETHKMFPKKTNVSFINIINPSEINIVTWERGVGYSESCGSAASASFIASFAQKLVNNSINVKSNGGELKVSLNSQNEIIISGQTSFVFEGNYNIVK